MGAGAIWKKEPSSEKDPKRNDLLLL